MIFVLHFQGGGGFYIQGGSIRLSNSVVSGNTGNVSNHKLDTHIHSHLS